VQKRQKAKKGAKRLSSALEEALEPESASRKTTLSKRIPSWLVALKYWYNIPWYKKWVIL